MDTALFEILRACNTNEEASAFESHIIKLLEEDRTKRIRC